MVQSITRLVQGLPISLLELNAFAHCICVMLVFDAWWHKPLDVSFPITIPGELYPEILAYMCMSFPADNYYGNGDEVEAVHFTTQLKNALSHGPFPGPLSLDLSVAALEQDSATLIDGQVLHESGVYLRDPAGYGVLLRLLHTIGRATYWGGSTMRPYFFKGRNPLSALDIRRWQLAATIFKEIPASLDTIEGAKALNTHPVLKVHRRSNFEDSFEGA
ncbi:hypothetical protein BDZ45DRAFT_450499 [Acephala macrosclerotiorum]|nr:hypothetical protein BDZ45DRAFT_450499 [Acephala macrosclerotiorum]